MTIEIPSWGYRAGELKRERKPLQVGAILSTIVTSPAEARARIVEALWCHSASVVAAAELITDELVTNAIVHGSPPVELAVTRFPDALKVAVTDGCTDNPVVLDAAPSDTHGRGMFIVATMADAWGTAERPDGKTVWFSLRL